MLSKRRIKKDNIVKVTFVAPEGDTSDTDLVEIAGDFTNWEPTTMKRRPQGDWRATFDLEPEREYEFRYRVGGERWVNDPEADGQRDNPFGDQNSVVQT